MIPRPISGAARIIPALDSGDAARAQSLAETLAPHCGVLKVGLELFTSAGPGIVSAMARHRPVFLDLKLHDIPNTVAGAVRSLLPLRPAMMTLHAAGGAAMIAAARAELMAQLVAEQRAALRALLDRNAARAAERGGGG